MKVMRGIWTEFLWMYEDPHKLPEEYKNASLGYVGKFEDLQFAIALTNGTNCERCRTFSNIVMELPERWCGYYVPLPKRLPS